MTVDRAALPGPAKYFFLRALRPFSLSVALVTCGLGSVLAWHDGFADIGRIVLVVTAAMLLQMAVNLFNDHADVSLWQSHQLPHAHNVIAMIERNVLAAKIMAGLAILIGLWLVYQSGWRLLVIGALGLLGGYFYTGEPVAYKNRGAGVLAVFIFTGVLMVLGSYVAITGQYSDTVLLYSIPVSMISSMLLLANELRDVRDDAINNIGTFTVRVGVKIASLLYRLLGLGAVFLALVLGLTGGMRWPLLMALPLLALIKPIRLLRHAKQARAPEALVKLPPLTGRYFVIFGLCMMLAI